MNKRWKSRTACVVLLLLGSTAVDAQTVSVTPLGAAPGEFSMLDRALVFEDPSGVRILYDPGLTVSATDARLGVIDAIILSHGHGDHVGNTAAIAASKNAAVITAPNLAGFLGGKIQGIRNQPTPLCGPSPPFGNGRNELTVPLTSPCLGLLGISASRVITRGGSGVEIIAVPANHDSSAAPGAIGAPLGTDLGMNGLTGYHDPANGFIVKFTNGLVVYLSGDTGLMAEMEAVIRRFYQPKLMVINIGDVFTTGPEAAAFAVTGLVQPKSVIASHANEMATTSGAINPGSRTARFKAAVGSATGVLAPPACNFPLNRLPGFSQYVCVGTDWLPPTHPTVLAGQTATPVYVPLSERTMTFDSAGVCRSGCN